MKFFKGALLALVLFAAHGINAKSRAAAKPAASGRPAATGQTIKQLRDEILKMRQNQVFSGNAFNQSFLNNITTKTKDLDKAARTFLLETAMYQFAPFIGDNQNDLKLLNDLKPTINRP